MILTPGAARFTVLAVLLDAFALLSTSSCQQTARLQPVLLATADDELPDAPGTVRERGRFSSSAVAAIAGTDATIGDRNAEISVIPFLRSKPVPPIAPMFHSRILAGQGAMPLSARDKLVLGVRREATVGQFAGVLFSAGWTHITDSRPHYGTDSAGFGERLGAAELRSFTKSAINFGVLSAALHTDPRYYQLGDTKPVKRRLLYAATRVFVGRRDDGSGTPNIAYLGSVVTSSALTNLYYPHRDRSTERTVAGIFTSLAGRSATLEWSEFGSDILHSVFHTH